MSDERLLSSANDYTVGRNNPIENVDSAALNALLRRVASAFNVPWLTRLPAQNRIQALWSRQDGLATNQLAILGDALTRITPGNQEWVARRIREVKSETAQNRKGDLFELLGLSLFALDGQRVVGAPDGNPGYDGAIDFGAGASALVSLKDFGTSSHRKHFETRSSGVEQKVVGVLQELRMTGLGVRIAASRFPLQADWDRLNGALGAVIASWRADQKPRTVGGIWTLTPQPLPTGPATLVSNYLSYGLILLAPHHKNEQVNIEAKMEGACVNLSKHGHTSLHAALFLLIRLPETASPARSVACAEQWLRVRPEARIDSVILYQPAVAAPSTWAPSAIAHFVAMIPGPGFERWRQTTGRPNQIVQARVLVGRCTNKPTKLLGTDGTLLDEHYVYQRGAIYTLSQARPDGTIAGNTTNPAPGIILHTVLRIPGQSGECVLSGKYPPDSNLLLYS